MYAELVTRQAERVLATVLFTDVVDATAEAVRRGDHGWAELLRRHHAIVRRLLVRHGGRELDAAGDGFFAAFDVPSRAVDCACAIRDELSALGLAVRVGIHTGECERIDGKLTGVAVHLGARVAAAAAPGEVLVSTTVRELVAGSGRRFADRGERRLKGLPEPARVFAATKQAA